MEELAKQVPAVVAIVVVVVVFIRHLDRRDDKLAAAINAMALAVDALRESLR